MRCPCGEYLKCIRRHPALAERDEYRCPACAQTLLRYDLQEIYRRDRLQDGDREVSLTNHPSAPTVPAAHTVPAGHSIEDAEQRPDDALVLIIVMIVTHLVLR